MCSPDFYRQQAHRCVMLSRATPDPKVRLWFTDMASQYVKKAEAAQEQTVTVPHFNTPALSNQCSDL